MEKETTEGENSNRTSLPVSPKQDTIENGGNPSTVRTASAEEFKKAQAKTSVEHAELFRRLAK